MKIINGIDATGQLFINEKDAWLTWGAFVVGESEDNLLLPASPKSYTENEFRSQKGRQVFIVNPQDDARDVQVEFCIMALSRTEYLTGYKEFIRELKDGLVVLRVPTFDEVYNFTVSGFLSLGYYGTYGKLSVRFNESYSVPVIFEALETETQGFLLTEDNKTILI